MFEFHGWVTIHESTTEVDAGNLESIVKNIQNFIADLHWTSGLLKIYPANGAYHLSVGGLLNRKSTEAEEIIKLYQFIAEHAIGSYGLLYTRDDEDIEGFDNEFRVLVLVRGRIEHKKDTFLSPFAPIVEDE
ncbi:Imm7 family immunity protein [Paenibacillus septentrionalis]|uniref:Imm7 family immunity protein n=1 Tax=Paenibacillus septentrionalis TaxID=429342 RepID=A0ABW1VA96_9BACL